MEYCFESKRCILQRLNDLSSKKCDLKIFKLIIANDIKHCTNNNGVFFNFNNLNDDLLNQIENIINYYENKKYEYSESNINSEY